MQTEDLIVADKVMDVRSIGCSVKHGLIIRTWLELPVGDYFILLNDHDPAPLRSQFAAQWPDTFTWEYLVNISGEARVKITKLNPLSQSAEPVAAACGGR